MLRSLFTAVCALLLVAASASAGEYRGKVQKVDAGSGTITVTVDGKERTFKVDSDYTVLGPKKKELPAKLKAKIFARKPLVTIRTKGEGDKEVVREIRIEARRR